MNKAPSSESSTTPLSSIGDRFVDWIVTKPWIAMIVGFCFVAGAMSGFPQIKANFTHTAFFRSTDPMLQEFDKFERQFGNDDAVAVVVHSPSGVFDRDTVGLLRELTDRMWLVHDVIRVDSLSNFNWVHAVDNTIEVEPLIPAEEELTDALLKERKEIALNHESIPDYLVSRDGKTALLYARIKPGFETPPDTQKLVLEVRSVLEELKRSDHELYITGGPVINFAFQESTQRDLSTLIPMVLVAAMIFLIFLLRSVSGVILPFITLFLSVGSAVAFAGHFGVELNSVTTTLPFIMIAVAIADSVHIMSTFMQGRWRGLDQIEAARRSLSKNLLPTLLTSITTAAGFFSFFSSDLKPVLGVGILAGSGTLMAWIITYLVMGPLLIKFPSRVKAIGGAEELKQASPRMIAYTHWLQRNRWKVIGIYAIFGLGALVLASYNKVNADPYKYFAKDYPLRQANEFIIDNLSGTAVFELRISAGVEEGIKEPIFMKTVESFEEKITQFSGVSKTVSIIDIIRQTNRSLNEGKESAYKLPETKELIAQELFLYQMSLPQGMDVNNQITVKNDAIRVTVIASITDSALWTDTAARFEALGKEMGLDVIVTGKIKLYQSMNGYVVRSFIESIIIAVLLVSLILILAFRSLRIGLLAMLPNMIPIIIGGAVLKLLDRSLDIGTVLVSSVCLGIAVDDTIHMLSNYLKHRREGLSATGAVSIVLTHTGSTLVVTTMVLVAAFGVMGFGTFVPNIYLGIMTAVILSAALITDLTFLPAILLTRAARED